MGLKITQCPSHVYVRVQGGAARLNTSMYCLQGMPYSLVKFTGIPEAQCLQGMLYSPMKFTGVPEAQCLQGMPCSPVRFTGVPDAQCLQGMPYPG